MFIWWIGAALLSAALIVLNGRVETVWIEAVGLVSAIWCVWDASHNRERNWAIGSVSCVAFFIIFAQAQLWGNMVLQLVYLVQAVMGDLTWRFGGNLRTRLMINALPALSKKALGFLFLAVTLGVTALLTALNGVAPFWDTITTVLSIVANHLLIRRRIENWYIWLVVDIISVALFASQGLWITTLTYVLYLFVSLFALPFWKKQANLCAVS